MGDKGAKILAKLEAKAMKRLAMVRFGFVDSAYSLDYTIPACLFNPLYRDVQALSIPPTHNFEGGSQIRAQDHGMRLCQRYGVDRYLDRYVLVADPDLDCLYVKGPTFYRSELVNMIIESDRHVICGAPTSTSDVEQWISSKVEREKDGVQRLCIMAQPLRFLTIVQKCRQLIVDKKIGSVEKLSCYYGSTWGTLKLAQGRYSWWHRRDHGGGVIGAFGFDCLDMLSYLLDSQYSRVQAKFRRARDVVDDRTVTSTDVAIGKAEMQCGVVCDVEMNSLVDAYHNVKRTVEISGSHGSIRLDLVKGELSADIEGDENVRYKEKALTKYSPIRKSGVSITSFGLSKLFDAVVRSGVRRKQNVKYHEDLFKYCVPIEEALPTVRAMDAMKSSVDHQGEWVNVE